MHPHAWAIMLCGGSMAREVMYGIRDCAGLYTGCHTPSLWCLTSPGLRPSQVRTLSGTKTAMELPPLQVRLICASAPSLNLFLRYHRLGRRIKCLTAVPPKNISISSVLRLHNSALLSKHSQSTSRSYSTNSSSPRYSRASSLCSTSLASLPRALRRRYVHVTFSYWNM